MTIFKSTCFGESSTFGSRLWICIAAAAFLCGCKTGSEPKFNIFDDTAALTTTRTWEVEGYSEYGMYSHEHADDVSPHIVNTAKFKLVNTATSGKRKFEASDKKFSPESDWNSVVFEEPTNYQIKLLQGRIDSLDCKENPKPCAICDDSSSSGCKIGVLETPYHSKKPDPNMPTQYHMVLLETLETPPKGMCERKKSCLQIEVFCANDECSIELPKKKQKMSNVTAGKDISLKFMHRGSGHAHSAN